MICCSVVVTDIETSLHIHTCHAVEQNLVWVTGRSSGVKHTASFIDFGGYLYTGYRRLLRVLLFDCGYGATRTDVIVFRRRV